MKYQNDQLYNECQLISLFNAMRFYNIVPPNIDTKEYYDICEKYSCINGACLNVSKLFKEFNMKKVEGFFDLNWIKNHLPVQLSVFCHRGFHAVLTIKIKKDKLLLANYAYNKLYWMKWNKIKEKMLENFKPIQIIKS